MIFRRHLFSKASSLLSEAAVHFQLSHPYNSTEFTLALKSRNLMCLLVVRDRQMLMSLLKALEARAILVFISESVSLSVVNLLPRYTKLWTLSIVLLSKTMGSVMLVKSIIFVSCIFIWRPICRAKSWESICFFLEIPMCRT